MLTFPNYVSRFSTDRLFVVMICKPILMREAFCKTLRPDDRILNLISILFHGSVEHSFTGKSNDTFFFYKNTFYKNIESEFANF